MIKNFQKKITKLFQNKIGKRFVHAKLTHFRTSGIYFTEKDGCDIVNDPLLNKGTVFSYSGS
jgi:hypothetical protein